MRGVGHELTLRAHGFVDRRAGGLEPLDHRVEAGRELADLVVGVVLDAAGQVFGVGDVLRGLGHLAEWREHAPRRQSPEARGERDPAGAQQEQDQP